VIAPDGSIRVVLAGGGTDHPAGFRLVEASGNRFTLIARGECPEGNVASLGQTSSGDSAVLCFSQPGTRPWRDEPYVTAGTFERTSGRWSWRWQGALDRTTLGYLVAVPYFVTLGSELALVFEGVGGKGMPAPRWSVAVVPSAGAPQPLCTSCEIVAPVVVDGVLRILLRYGSSYEEVRLTPGGLVRANLTPTDAEDAVAPGEPCVARSDDGSTVVRVPIERAGIEARTTTGLLRYDGAWLPHGPHVHGADGSACPPERFLEGLPSELPSGLRRWVRASRRDQWLVVYDMREVGKDQPGDSHFAAPDRHHDYPGSLRIAHPKPSPATD
jgi:hypothetical protein